MKTHNSTGGRSGRRPRRSAVAKVGYTKDSAPGYYTLTTCEPAAAVPALLPERVYLSRPHRPDIARNCELMLSHSPEGGMLTGLRRSPRTGSYRGNVLVYDPAQRRRVRRELVATIDGPALTITLY